MVHGTADINMRDFDPRGPYATRDYQIAGQEDYVLRHGPYPRAAAATGAVRPVALDRLAEARRSMKRSSAGSGPAGSSTASRRTSTARRPAWHAVFEECKAVRERVGVMDLSAFGKIDVSRPDANFVERMIANRPRKVSGIVLTHILNRKGTIEAEVTVARVAGRYFMFLRSRK